MSADRAVRFIAHVGSVRIIVSLAVAIVLLALSLWGNVSQLLNHREYVRGEATRLQLAASQAAVKVAAKIAGERKRDNAELLKDLDAIAEKSRTTKIVYAKAAKSRPLPAQCAPGKARMDAVNAGADK